jgi:hypothetical protein
MANHKLGNPPKNNLPTIDVEEVFKQVAGRMEQIRREYRSAEAYQEDRRLQQQSKPTPKRKGR